MILETCRFYVNLAIPAKETVANPSVRNGHIDIANELAEQFARTTILGNDWQVFWVVLRQTWGWKEGDRKKAFDFISLTQFQRKTGLCRASVVRSLQRLVARRLLLKRENGYGINQNYEQWVVAAKLPSSSSETTPVAPVSPKVVAVELPTIDKKDTSTKDTTNGGTKIRQDIKKWLGKSEINNPEAYLEKIKTFASNAIITRAWKESRRGNGVDSPSAFYERCSFYAKKDVN